MTSMIQSVDPFMQMHFGSSNAYGKGTKPPIDHSMAARNESGYGPNHDIAGGFVRGYDHHVCCIMKVL